MVKVLCIGYIDPSRNHGLGVGLVLGSVNYLQKNIASFPGDPLPLHRLGVIRGYRQLTVIRLMTGSPVQRF